MSRRMLWGLACTILVAGAGAYWYFNSKSASATGPKDGHKPVLVSVATVQQSDIPLRIESTGYLSPNQNVEVRPQVSGVLRSVLVHEGAYVSAGTHLFSLDDGPEQAALTRAQAQLLRDQVQLDIARRNLERSKSLNAQKFLSPQEWDTLQSNVETANATIAADDALVAAARLDVSHKQIYSPMAGRLGAITVFPGSIVQASMPVPMVVLAQLDPIMVSFTVPESQWRSIAGVWKKESLPVQAVLAEQPENVLHGELSFIDNNIDVQTGMIRMKAIFKNTEHLLWPGVFVRVTLDAGIQQNVLSLPITAVQTGPENKFVFVVAEDNSVSIAPVNLLDVHKDVALVSGIAAGLRVVSVGGQNLRPGDVVEVADIPGSLSTTGKEAAVHVDTHAKAN